MLELVVLPEADQDVDAQAEYFRDRGTPNTAIRWLVQTRKTFEFLAANPGLGAVVNPGLFAWRVEKFKQQVVIYRSLADRVEIVRVLHGAADLDTILSP